MKLYIKQRVFTIGQKFDICDEQGNYLYYCRGEILTIGRKLHIYDRANNEVAYIRQRLFRFLPNYDIYINGAHETTLVKKFQFFRHDYYYDNLPYNIYGEFLAHDYHVYHGGGSLMTVKKRWLTWGDTYEIDIMDESKLLLMLASAIVIDCVCHEGNGD